MEIHVQIAVEYIPEFVLCPALLRVLFTRLFTRAKCDGKYVRACRSTFAFSRSYFRRIFTRLVIPDASRYFQIVDQSYAITIVFLFIFSVPSIFRNTEAFNNIDGYFEK